MKTILLTLALLLLAARTSAEEPRGNGPTPRLWAVTARTSYVYIGHAERPTGGMQLAAEATRSWPLGERSSVAAGIALSMFGFDVGPRWLAILGGPVASIRTQVWGPISVGASVHLDFGRLPTCTRWGFCMLSSGFFPLGGVAVSYDPSERVSIAAHGGVRVIRTLPYSGAGLDTGIAGTFRF